MNRAFHLLAAAGLLLAGAGTAPAQLGQDRSTGLTLSGDEPIQIESDRFEVDEAKSVGVFTGNVSVVQGPTLIKSAKMTVHYERGGGSAVTGSAQIEKIEVEGGVYVKSEEQVATGERGTFDMKTEVLVLTGKEVVLSEGENVVVGCKLTVHMQTGQGKLESCKEEGSTGRVRMLLTPGSQDRQ